MHCRGVFGRSLVCALYCCGALGQQKPPIEIVSIPKVSRYRDAAMPDALRYACAPILEAVRLYLEQKGLPFEPKIVRTSENLKCHILYEPTLPGFHALPDDYPITEIFLDVDMLGFVSHRTERFGDTLDVARQWLPKLPGPLRISLGMPLNQEQKHYNSGLAFHFPLTAHTFSFRENTWDQTNPWVQDYLKAGVAGGQSKILVTRLAFEGRAENGDMFKPMLDSLKEDRFVRSKLSWEGGDLQFVHDPKDPSKTLLFYGHSSSIYWAERLSPDEYAYVLRVEFGADESIDFRDISSHVDYFVSFLPHENIALVSEPDRGNYELARAAVTLLKDYFTALMQPEILELDRLFSSREEAFGSNLDRIRRVLKQISEKQEKWPLPFSMTVGRNIEGYVAQNCPTNPGQCVSPSGIARMLAQDPALLHDWGVGAVAVRGGERLTDRVGSIIRSELPGFKGTIQPIVEAKVKLLESRGFRVIRVPRLAGDPLLHVDWPGVSYVNSTLVDHTLFVPEFGLGAPEQAIFDRLRAQLPSSYTVVPLFARSVLLRNGGIHCMSGLVRSPEKVDKPETASSVN